MEFFCCFEIVKIKINLNIIGIKNMNVNWKAITFKHLNILKGYTEKYKTN